ncbi:MAG: glycosyltransferase, partial [Methylococcales bacterium]
MKIVVNALSARLGGGQTYLVNLLRHIPDRDDLSILVFAPEDLDLPEHPRVRRLSPSWPTKNPLLRTVWEKFMLPRFLRSQGAEILFCPGGVVTTPKSAGFQVVTMFRNMIPFDPRVRRSLPWGLQRLRNWILYRVMLRSMAHADLTIFVSDYARKVIEAL